MSITRSAIIQPELLLIDTFTEASGTVGLISHTPDYNPGGYSWALVSGFTDVVIVAANDLVSKTAASALTYIDFATRPSKIKVKLKNTGVGKTEKHAVCLRMDSTGNGILVEFGDLDGVGDVALYELAAGVKSTIIGSLVPGSANNLATSQEITITDNGTTITVDGENAVTGATITDEDITGAAIYSTITNNKGVGFIGFDNTTTPEWDDLIVYA